ncbi:MAG TPA: 5-formyltetrahydrofolate cyclo-ligase [Steroidobacteraceae bacterium]|nr:5-formyltetrahydrofolate cyclo-ligase [Steroidobacteraceae bacterium]
MLESQLLKARLRKELRSRRRQMSCADHALRSNLAASAITRLAAFKPAARVAVYLPFDRETNTAALLVAARRRRVRIYVPVIDSKRYRRLRFYPLCGKTRRGVFGISVPHGAARRRAVAPRWFDLIVVPLVGVDAGGYRLGMGGGFYDRALAFRRNRRGWRGPWLVGLAFQCQRADSVFPQSHDVRLDALATETGLQLFTGDPT